MSERYAREVLRRNVAQICQTIGWNGIQSTPLEVLVHVLEKYVRTLGVASARQAELQSRTEPNLHDLGLAFQDLNIHLPELGEYVRSVPPAPCSFVTDPFPHPKESHLNFLKPGSHEVVTRPMHVHEHLPPMYPEKEAAPPAVADTVEIHQNGHDSPNMLRSTSPEISVTDSPEKKDPFKRPPDPLPLPPSKRPRIKLEEEECHTREISSVMMTMSGFLSPAREGKLPEAVAPMIMSERHSDKHKSNSHHSNLMRVPSLQTSLEKSDKKSKKSKLVNGKVMKNKKKDKHRSDSSKSKHDRIDKLQTDLSQKKDLPPTHINNVTTSAPRPPPPVHPHSSMLENIRPVIKQEPIDPDIIVQENSSHLNFDNIPIPRKIPIGKSPLATSTTLIHPPKPVTSSHSLIPPIEIKKEIVDDEEKLASQPDRSKLNIFKRISSKSKEEKLLPEIHEKYADSFNRGESTSSHNVKNIRHPPKEPVNKVSQELINNNSEMLRLDQSRGLDLSNEVINIDDDSLDLHPPYIKPDPDGIPVPVPVPVSKLKQMPFTKDLGVTQKPKKEKKHKEKRDKVAEKAAKQIRKQEMLAAAMAAQGHVGHNRLHPKVRPPKIGKLPKNESSKFMHMPSNFPFFPPGRGLMPGPGLIPNLIPGNELYTGLTSNPALRGLSPNLLANPFALPGGPGLIPGPSFMQGPGLLPPGFLSNMKPPNKSTQPQFNLMRRPSLEVIPLENDESKKQTASHVREDRFEKHKMTIPNILQKHSPPKNRISKDNISKSNAYKMPTITPDVTIQLNPPAQKIEPKPEPPSPVQTEPELLPVPSPPAQLVPETSITEIPKEKSKDSDDRRIEKLMKKIKKEKDGLKIKKKKDKKDKNKLKSEKRKDKEEKVEGKEKIKKEKKEKKRDKEKPPAALEAVVPKLTLKLGSASPMPPSSPEPLKLNIKPIKKEPDITTIESKEETSRENSRSPELAQIAALVTRPPKPKSTKHNHTLDQSVEQMSSSPSPQASSISPPRKNRPPSGHSKYKRIMFKPLTKRSQDEESSVNLLEEDPPPQGLSVRPSVDKSGPAQLTTPYYTDEHGNKVWVCPACGRPDNGSPMIGCDGCDCWYHWVCVGITVDPGTSEDWFCKSCVAKRAAMVTALAGVTTGRKRGRKPKAERVKEGQ